MPPFNFTRKVVRLEEESKSRNDRKAKEGENQTAGSSTTDPQLHGHLCEVRVLDPACGSGNFLYVSLELMKRLEGEVSTPFTSSAIINSQAMALTTAVLGMKSILAPPGLRTGSLDRFPSMALSNSRQDRPTRTDSKSLSQHRMPRRVLAWDSIEPVVDSTANPSPDGMDVPQKRIPSQANKSRRNRAACKS